MIPTLCPPNPNPNINEPPHTHQPSHPPIICSNNTIITISLLQIRQSNGWESVANDYIFILHLRSSAGPRVSISCILLHTSHIQLTLPTQRRKVDLKPMPKRGSNKINRLRPTRKNTSENKLYHTAWTYKRELTT